MGSAAELLSVSVVLVVVAVVVGTELVGMTAMLLRERRGGGWCGGWGSLEGIVVRRLDGGKTSSSFSSGFVFIYLFWLVGWLAGWLAGEAILHVGLTW